MKKVDIENVKDVLEINVIKSPNSPVTILSNCNKCTDTERSTEIDWI